MGCLYTEHIGEITSPSFYVALFAYVMACTINLILQAIKCTMTLKIYDIK